REERSGRNDELRMLGDMELGRDEFPLRLSALVAEESVGRQLRAAGTEFRHSRPLGTSSVTQGRRRKQLGGKFGDRHQRPRGAEKRALGRGCLAPSTCCI